MAFGSVYMQHQPCDCWLLMAVYCISFWVACRGSRSPSWPPAMWIKCHREKPNVLHLYSVSLNCFPLSLVCCSSASTSKQVISDCPSAAFRWCAIKVKPTISWAKLSPSATVIASRDTRSQLSFENTIQRKGTLMREVDMKVLFLTTTLKM